MENSTHEINPLPADRPVDGIQLALAHVILRCPANITGFYNWHKFTDQPIPTRLNYENDREYVMKNWRKLKHQVTLWLEAQGVVDI